VRHVTHHVGEPESDRRAPSAGRERRDGGDEERRHALLQEGHALLRKLIRFTSARKPTSSPSSVKHARRSE